jgi:hypothetical protein
MMKLKNESDVAIAKPRQFVIRHRRNLGIPDSNRAGVRPIESAEQMQQRRLADARGSDDRQHLAALDAERHVVEDRHGHLGVAIRLRKRPRLEKGHERAIMPCGGSLARVL